MTPGEAPWVADSLGSFGHESGERVPVVLSHEIIGLLSEQMYGSPLKAIEELVVNAYDADSKECRITVPSADKSTDFIAVYDSGSGMDHEAIRDLWNIGRSRKREEQIQLLRSRKQIGKFGIGKLATYAVATRVTYISKKDGTVLAVTTDFSKFDSSSSGQTSEVKLPVYEIANPTETFGTPRLQAVLEELGLEQPKFPADVPAWTLVILENLKPDKNIHMGRLRWILATAMPLKLDFEVQLNGKAVDSAKEGLTKVVDFSVKDLPESRLTNLRNITSQVWKISEGKLVSDNFPSGITGTVMVTEPILRTGKSDDIMRSHGFFVRVRERLVNERDPRFGLHELQHEVFNRFRADIEIDDLDSTITAPREGVGDSNLRETAEKVLNEIFNEARRRYDSKQINPGPRKKEHEMGYVPQSLFEFPTADALSIWDNSGGADADDSWFYIADAQQGHPLSETIQKLYSGERKDSYKYDYEAMGRSARMVKFLPDTSEFVLNDDHEIVRAYKHGGQAQVLLEDLATAEAMLEVYLMEADISPKTAGDILEKRDQFLRALASDHLSSVASISQSLLDASNQDHDLEIALVAAARAVGFVAKHIGGAGPPDGIATLLERPGVETKITLEAKSSNQVPSIATIGMGTLAEHVKNESAAGCLLVAPDFPGEIKGNDSSISQQANMNRVSCWTIKQLADVVAATETRHISARKILKIILTKFSPTDVAEEVEALLSYPVWEAESLYTAVINALHLISGVPDARPTADMVLGQLVSDPDYPGVSKVAVLKALEAVSSSSKGAMVLRGEEVKINTSIDELRRRTAHITGEPTTPRRNGDFRLGIAK